MRENTDQKNSEYEHFLCNERTSNNDATGEKVECLSLVNYSAKTNHDNNDNNNHCHREDDST